MYTRLVKTSKLPQILAKMCGRYTLVKKPISIGGEKGKKIKPPLDDEGIEVSFQKRYNIAPTQQNWVIRQESDKESLRASLMRWGLVPSWSKTGSTQSLLINARSETIADKPSFKASYQRRRCLVPADGYYEWKRQRNVNQPYYIQMADESLFYMAGIWETWHDPAGAPFESYAILTTQANALTGKIHDRMPVILQGERNLEWLEGASQLIDTDARFELFAAIDPGLMQYRPVNPVVNNNQNDGPDCIAEPPIEATTQMDMEF